MIGAGRLAGRSAVVTGGAGLLGVEHAVALSTAGARVALLDTNVERLGAATETIRGRVPNAELHSFASDVTSLSSLREVNEALKDLGVEVDVLVNNAAVNPAVKADGVSSESNAFETFPLARWELELSVGLTGAFLASQVFGSEMALRGEGAIINVASDLSVIAPDQRLYSEDDTTPARESAKPVTYSVAKFALIGLTKYLSTYWAEDGVRVNALSPGGVRLDQPEAFTSRLHKRIPMGRMANPDEYHGALVFLASSDSAYMTGQNLVIDGGRTVW